MLDLGRIRCALSLNALINLLTVDLDTGRCLDADATLHTLDAEYRYRYVVIDSKGFAYAASEDQANTSSPVTCPSRYNSSNFDVGRA